MFDEGATAKSTHRALLFVAVFRWKVPLYPPNEGGIHGPYGAHMANLAAFIRHEIRKMRAIMASQLSRTRLVIY